MQSNVIRSKVQFSRIILTIGLVLILAILLLPKTVGAEGADGQWSWTDIKPVVFSSIEISDMAPSLCPTVYHSVDIAGEFEPKNVCVNDGEKVSFGTTTTYGWGGFTRVVGFGYDSKMYKFWGPCDRSDSCIYLGFEKLLLVREKPKVLNL